ncbi:MAG TPA: hypothetical protein PLV59_01350 [Candidatus Dojkabacteria bacterium]|nr:hypothetical protein [Candidatus Dojkabacteria bacterium]
MDPKTKALVIVLAILCVFSIIGTATFGFMYFNLKGEYTQLKNQVGSNQDKEDGSSDNDSQNPETPDTSVDNDGDTSSEVKTVTKEIVCKKWVYASADRTPTMSIVYEDDGGVQFTDVNEECTGIKMTYEDATLNLTFSYGEGFPNGFEEGAEIVKLKTGTVENQTYTLGRLRNVESRAATSEFPAGYWLDYVSIEDEETCAAENMDGEAGPGYPCYMGANPFVTPAGQFSLYIPKGKTSEEILDIVLYFDQVAKNSSYKYGVAK